MSRMLFSKALFGKKTEESNGYELILKKLENSSELYNFWVKYFFFEKISRKCTRIGNLISETICYDDFFLSFPFSLLFFCMKLMRISLCRLSPNLSCLTSFYFVLLAFFHLVIRLLLLSRFYFLCFDSILFSYFWSNGFSSISHLSLMSSLLVLSLTVLFQFFAKCSFLLSPMVIITCSFLALFPRCMLLSVSPVSSGYPADLFALFT